MFGNHQTRVSILSNQISNETRSKLNPLYKIHTTYQFYRSIPFFNLFSFGETDLSLKLGKDSTSWSLALQGDIDKDKSALLEQVAT